MNNQWGLFGYSQFVPANYEDYLLSFGFSGIKRPKLEGNYTRDDHVDIGKNLGCYAVPHGMGYENFIVKKTYSKYLVANKDLDVIEEKKDSEAIDKAKKALIEAKERKLKEQNDLIARNLDAYNERIEYEQQKKIKSLIIQYEIQREPILHRLQHRNQPGRKQTYKTGLGSYQLPVLPRRIPGRV